MRPIFLILGALVVTGAVILATLSGQDSPPPPAWRAVRTWSGDDFLRTEAFEVRSREWRVDWKTTDPDEEANYFSLWVYTADGQRQQMITTFANEGAKADIARLTNGPGSFYLEISPSGLVWTVIVEDRR